MNRQMYIFLVFYYKCVFELKMLVFMVVCDNHGYIIQNKL